MDLVDFLRIEELGGGFFFSSTLLMLALIIAILIVTGLALYKAARLQDQGWFWILLLINSMGVLPLTYLYIKRKEKPYYVWRGKK